MFDVICLMQMSVKPRIFIIQDAAVYITKILSIFGKFLNACIARLVHCSLLNLCGLAFDDLNTQICGT